jgi:hypothetical protein
MCFNELHTCVCLLNKNIDIIPFHLYFIIRDIVGWSFIVNIIRKQWLVIELFTIKNSNYCTNLIG